MTDRIRLDDLTSDQLDQLYERLEAAENAIARVRAIHVPRDNGNCAARCYGPGLAPQRSPCSTITALDEPEEG